MNLENQSYANHRRMHPLYHYVLSLLNVAMLVCALIWLVQSVQSSGDLLPAIMFLLMSLISIATYILLRTYPLKAQDRAIRAEENLRHYALTQKLLDPRLGMKQIVALRFASDAEFPALCRKAAEEQLSPDAIKKSIRQWRDDTYRI